MHSIIQGYNSQVLDVLPIFRTLQLYEQMMPVAITDSGLTHPQASHLVWSIEDFKHHVFVQYLWKAVIPCQKRLGRWEGGPRLAASNWHPRWTLQSVPHYPSALLPPPPPPGSTMWGYENVEPHLAWCPRWPPRFIYWTGIAWLGIKANWMLPKYSVTQTLLPFLQPVSWRAGLAL